MSKKPRVNFGTMGFNNQMFGDFKKMESAYTPPAPLYNEGIQTLVNTYSPPSDLQQQAAGQRLRASQTNVPAQNLANQQAAAFQNLLVNAGVIADPNLPVDPPPVEDPPQDPPIQDPIVDDPPMDDVIDYNQDVQELLDDYDFYTPILPPNIPLVPDITPGMPLGTFPITGSPMGGQDFTYTGLTGMPTGLDTLIADYNAPTVVQDLEPTRPADIVVDR
tara:strand:+ start:167 stop:823 length:657 start_codon:yes stop_codon:yes gene_type:complete